MTNTLEQLLRTGVHTENGVGFTPEFRIAVQEITEDGVRIIIANGHHSQTLDFVVRRNTLSLAPVPIHIRGVTYPSINAAGRALGITAQAVRHALDEGRLETVGLRRRNTRAKPVYYKRKWYRSIQELKREQHVGSTRAQRIWKECVKRGVGMYGNPKFPAISTEQDD